MAGTSSSSTNFDKTRSGIITTTTTQSAVTAVDSVEALSRSQPDLFTGIEQRYLIKNK